MDPFTAGIGAVGGITKGLFDLFGASQQRKLQRQAAELAQRGVGELQGGKGYNAQDALAFLGLTDRSAYQDMDPASKVASMEALAQLVKRGAGTGLDIQSKEALSQAIARSGAAQNAARQAILQEYTNMGGQGGSGAALAAMLQGQQANYGQLAEATGTASAAAEQRRLEANVLASRAGQQQQQLEQQKAAALDALQRFNVGARQNTLDLENKYRQGAASQYLGAGQTMAGIAKDASRPYGGAAEAFSGAAQGVNALGQQMGWWGNQTQPQGEPSGYDYWQGGNQQPNLGNWTMQQPQAPANYSPQYQIPETKLKNPGSAW